MRPTFLCSLFLLPACLCGGGTLSGSEDTPAACRDGHDNDGDGKIDCLDSDCFAFSFCAGGSGGGAGGGTGGCGSPADLNGCPCDTPAQTRPCYTGPTQTRNEGTCHDGTQTCTGGTTELGAVWGACSGESGPAAAELCSDTQDHDCNGAAGCQDVACSTAQGCVHECAMGETRPCYLGPAGTSGVGICHAGTQTCGLEGSWDPMCSNQATPGGEGGHCSDGLDNDCDGQTDCSDLDCLLSCVTMCTANQSQACYDGPAGTAGVASCKAGTKTCSSDGKMWSQCDGQVRPGDEGSHCADGVDNDCNGKIDCQDPACSTKPMCCTMPTGTPADGTLYAHSATDLYVISPNGWTVSHVGAFGNGDEITDLAVTPNGNLYGVSYTSLYSINKSTAHATYVADVSGAANNGLTFLPDGSLLASDTSGEVKRINPTTGAVSNVGNFDQSLSSAGDLVAVADGTMYGVSATTAGGGDASGNNVLLRVDPATGHATVVGPIGYGDVWGLAYANATVIGFTTSGQILQIDPATGAGALLATRSVVFWGAGMSPLVEGNACP